MFWQPETWWDLVYPFVVFAFFALGTVALRAYFIFVFETIPEWIEARRNDGTNS